MAILRLWNNQSMLELSISGLFDGVDVEENPFCPAWPLFKIVPPEPTVGAAAPFVLKPPLPPPKPPLAWIMVLPPSLM